MIDSIYFYLPQILIGSIVGISTAGIGVLVLLRKGIFMGITLSQAITVALIITLILEIHNEILILILGILFFLPVYFLYNKIEFKEAILASGFVFYAALGQILTALGANVQNHIVIAYFGNILLIPSKEWLHILVLLLVVYILFIIFYKKILAISFDLHYSKIIKMNVLLVEIIYFLILTAILTMSIYYMGSFYSIAHLVIPSLIAITIARNMISAFLLSSLISLISTMLGFTISLWQIQIQNQNINLPTSSTIILVMSLFLIVLLKKK
ncbi:MAG: metal ABC transporter permease [Leptonema sp. (in: bacteria)]